MSARTGSKGSVFGRWGDEMAAFLWLVALSLLVLSGARGATGVLKQQRERDYPQLGVVVVKPGDCLWTIAKRFGRHGEDPRRMVHLLAAANRLPPGHILHPGDRLVIPLFDTETFPESETVLARR